MGKHKRKYRKYLKGQIDSHVALGTLAANTLVSVMFADTLTEKAWLSSVDASWSLDDFTQGADRGPILVGVAHSDYADAEIEAWVENISSWQGNDLVNQEIARRKIRRVGIFPMQTSEPSAVLNDGESIHTKCGWQLYTGQGLRLWAYNMGSAALATTDPDMGTQGYANLWPN